MLFSNKDLRKIIIPLMIQQLLSVTVGMADSMMVASAGEAAVSAVSLVHSLDLLIMYIFLAMSTGGAVIISQAIGRGDRAYSNKSAKQLFYAVTIISSIVAVIVILLREPLLRLLFGDVEDAVMNNALDYFFYLALSFPVFGMFESISAIFRAMGKSMVTMTSSLIINAVNIAGNAILIFVFDMGAAGAAIATLLSRVVGAGIMLFLIHNKDLPVYIEKIFKYKPDFSIIKSILRIGIPSGVENGMFQLGKLLTQSLISSFGTVSIAANAVASSMASLQYVPGNAMGIASVAVVGKCIGAGEKKQAKKYSLILLGVAYATLAVVVLGMSIFVKPIIGLYGLSGESSALARDLMLFHGIAAACIWPLGFFLPHVFRAASDVKLTLFTSASCMWIFRVAFGYVLALESISVFGLFTIPGFGMGVMGVWVAMIIDWIVRSSIYLVHYLRGKWLTKYHGV